MANHLKRRVYDASDDNEPPSKRLKLSTNNNNNNNNRYSENVIVEDLSDTQKREILNQFKYGNRIKNGPKVQQSKKLLFTIKKDIREWGNVMKSAIHKRIAVTEHENSLEQSLAEKGYFSNEIRAGIAKIGCVTLKNSEQEQVYSKKGRKKIEFMATYHIPKVVINIDNESVEYSSEFETDLNELISNMSVNKAEWMNLIDRYGLWYISECVIGGSVHYSTIQTVNNNEEKVREKTYFQAAFQTAIQGMDVSSDSIYGNETEIEKKESHKYNMSMFNVRGGNTAKCSPNKYFEWEESINMNHKLWTVIEVISFKPFYNLLPVHQQELIKKLMPQFDVISYQLFKPDEIKNKTVQHRGQTQQRIKMNKYMKCNVWCIINITNKTRYKLEYGSHWMKSGIMEVMPQNINCYEKTCAALRKYHHTACGAVGVLQFEMNNKYIQLLISAPYNFNHFDNWIAIGVSPTTNKTYQKATEKTYEELYYKYYMGYQKWKRVKGGNVANIVVDGIGKIYFFMTALHKAVAEITFQ